MIKGRHIDPDSVLIIYRKISKTVKLNAHAPLQNAHARLCMITYRLNI